MDKVSLSNKVFTENPLLDEIVYNIRQIVYGGITIKDSDMADDNETQESVINGDLLVAIKSGRAHFFSFYYDENLLSKYYLDTDSIIRYSEDNYLIPESDRPALLEIAITDFLNKYIEKNDYYRMIHGEPYYDKTNTYEGLWIDIREINDTTPTSPEYIYYMPPTTNESELQYYQLIHELPLNYKNILFENGTCSNFVNSTRWEDLGLTKNEVLYLLHIGDREVDYYDARVAERFSLLYCPGCESEEVKLRFKELFEANRLYMLYTVYSEAYKFRSDYYDNFMMIFLIIQTIIDMIVELPEYIIRRDIFDSRTCKYIFESNGVKYFKDIPLKYQISLVKNLNKLIKFKSTDKCIVDIISIFGVENIQVFRYYILKDRLALNSKDLGYYNNKKDITDSFTEETTSVLDNDSNYDLKFIKVPLFENYDNYIRNGNNLYDYSAITKGDRYWEGDRNYDTVLKDIKDLDFTVLRSKYYSIEAVIDLSKRNFTTVYFMNLLLYNKVDTSLLKVSIPSISTTKKFDFVNAILTLFSLSYLYYGVEDVILDSRRKIATVLGFNMEANLAEISSWLAENNIGLTLKDLHVDTFKVPENGKIMSFGELEDIFFTNKDCYDHIISVLINPPSKKIYDVYKHLYEILMDMNMNYESFLIGGDMEIVDQYKQLGYNTIFRDIPDISQYTSYDNYIRAYEEFMTSLSFSTLCFNMSKDFNETHEFEVYIKETIEVDNETNEENEEDDEETNEKEVKDVLTQIGTVQMASTYKEYLNYADVSLFSYINKIQAFTDIESRQEACINAIQAIVSSLKNYVDQTGDDGIPLDIVFANIPSISVDFVKKYITEVIDFFKSFKIFTHDSSIIYLINNKFENYVQIIEDILLRYVFDKSELVRIEDAIGGKVKVIGDKILDIGNGIGVSFSSKQTVQMIEKIWFSIFTWLNKNYTEYYNNDKYKDLTNRIREAYACMSTYVKEDSRFTDEDNERIKMVAIDSILQLLVSLALDKEKIFIEDKVNLKKTSSFSEYYNEWMADIMTICINKYIYDEKNIKDDIAYIQWISTFNMGSISHIVDKTSSVRSSETFNDKIKMSDDLYTIITKSV